MKTFFHSFGLALLVGAWSLNPETAQFKDMLQMLHASLFWQIVATIAVVLTGVRLMFNGKITAIASGTAFKIAGTKPGQ